MATVGQKYGISGDVINGWTFTGTVVGSSGAFTSPVSAANGTAALPSFTFTSDPDCGFYRAAANSVGVSANGTSVGTFQSTGWNGAVVGNVTGNVTGNQSGGSVAATTLSASGVATFAVGAVGTPSIIFSGDTNTGLYWIGADSFGLAANGVVQATVTTAGINGVVGGTTPAAGSFTTVSASGVATFAAGAVGAPSVTFTGDTDTGLYAVGANSFALVANGAAQATITTGGINGVLGGTTPAAATVTTLTASSTFTLGGTAVSATAAELNYLDIATLGTGAASKAVVLDAGDDYVWPATGVLTAGVLRSVGPNFLGGTLTRAQAAPAAKTTTAGITAAELVAGLITTTGETAPSLHQLPTGTEIDAAIPGIATGDSFDFTVINTGTGAGDDATITVNTDVTIVGNPTVGSLTDATIISGSGTFRARRSATNAYVVYRLS